jgi:hypothetical protein
VNGLVRTSIPFRPCNRERPDPRPGIRRDKTLASSYDLLGSAQSRPFLRRQNKLSQQNRLLDLMPAGAESVLFGAARQHCAERDDDDSQTHSRSMTLSLLLVPFPIRTLCHCEQMPLEFFWSTPACHAGGRGRGHCQDGATPLLVPPAGTTHGPGLIGQACLIDIGRQDRRLKLKWQIVSALVAGMFVGDHNYEHVRIGMCHQSRLLRPYRPSLPSVSARDCIASTGGGSICSAV